MGLRLGLQAATGWGERTSRRASGSFGDGPGGRGRGRTEQERTGLDSGLGPWRIGLFGSRIGPANRASVLGQDFFSWASSLSKIPIFLSSSPSPFGSFSSSSKLSTFYKINKIK